MRSRPMPPSRPRRPRTPSRSQPDNPPRLAPMTSAGPRLLGPADVRSLAVRRIVKAAGVGPDDVVVEVGPGLGSLTLGLLAEVARVVAVEVDPVLAAALPETLTSYAGGLAERCEVVLADAMRIDVVPGPP